jgi:hypothetical protein
MTKFIQTIWDRVLEYGMVVLITIAFSVIYIIDYFKGDNSEDYWKISWQSDFGKAS